MAGSVGETDSPYVSMRTATGGIASVMNSRAAAPPKTVKIGAPRTAAVRINQQAGPGRNALEHLEELAEPQAHDDARAGDGPARPARGGAPHDPRRDQAK